MNKTTPGPWELEDTTLSICRLIVSVEDVDAIEVHPTANPNHIIAYLPNDEHSDEQRANARMIVAVPAMRQSISDLIQIIRSGRAHIDLDIVETAEAILASVDGTEDRS